MKLIDVVKKMPWPEGASDAVQEDSGKILWYSGRRLLVVGSNHTLCDDYKTAIVSHADWLAAQEQADQKEREVGYYWVTEDGGDWSVSEWDGEYFWVGDSIVYPSEIDERRIVRQP